MTLSPEAIEWLDALAETHGGRGRAVEYLLEFYATHQGKKKRK